MYLSSSSNYPPNTKKGLAYGLGLCIRRICEKESDYLQHRQELKLQLRRRGYSGKLIETQLRKVDKLDRGELLGMKRQDKNAKRVPLVVTFSNLLPDMHSVVRKHMDVLYRSGKMREVFQEPPIVAFRRDRNLCDTLVHSKTNKVFQPDVPRWMREMPADCKGPGQQHFRRLLIHSSQRWNMPNAQCDLGDNLLTVCLHCVCWGDGARVR